MNGACPLCCGEGQIDAKYGSKVMMSADLPEVRSEASRMADGPNSFERNAQR